MDSEVIADSYKLVQSGGVEQNNRRFDSAGLYFWKALTCLDKIPATIPRCDQTRQLAALFLRVGHEDLSLLASREAIRLDELLMDEKRLASDLIFYGNLHYQLSNFEEAKCTYKEVIDLCLRAEDFANAAAASTNLATILGNTGNGKQAMTLLLKSIEYLSKHSFPDTEFRTHVILIQTVDKYDGDPALAVKSGVTLSKHFGNKLTNQIRSVLIPLLQKAVDAWLKEEPQDNPDLWKRENLPWVYSDVANVT